MLASLLVVGAVLVGLESGVVGSTGSSMTPLSSPVVLDEIVESRLDVSTRRRAARRTNVRPINGDSDAQPVPVAAVGRLRVQWSSHASPLWRGPPVLLI